MRDTKNRDGVITWGMLASIVSVVGPMITAAWFFNSKIDHVNKDLNENHVEVVQRLSIVETDVKNIKTQVEKLKD